MAGEPTLRYKNLARIKRDAAETCGRGAEWRPACKNMASKAAMRMDCDALSPMRTVGPQGRYASMSLFANILIGLHRLTKYLTRKERLL